MRAVRSIKNQYLGINAHLHSYWQEKGGWPEFHTKHIVDILTTLKRTLMPLGYSARLEDSLQIRRLGHDDVTDPESDVTVYDLDAVRPPMPSGYPGELVLPIPESVRVSPRSEKDFSAVKIYEYDWTNREYGDPVAWIELLSPSNKPGGGDAAAYYEKRFKLLLTGLTFVEIDYLHESAPTFRGIPNYRTRPGSPGEADAHPYRIVVIEPRPSFNEGVIRSREFDVDVPIPTVRIPLSGEDVLEFDFGLPYQKTYEEMVYGLDAGFVDYAAFPHNFDRYSPDDQQHIVNRMLSVIEAVRDGCDLETDSFPTRDLPLDDALTEIESLRQG